MNWVCVEGDNLKQGDLKNTAIAKGLGQLLGLKRQLTEKTNRIWRQWRHGRNFLHDGARVSSAEQVAKTRRGNV